MDNRRRYVSVSLVFSLALLLIALLIPGGAASAQSAREDSTGREQPLTPAIAVQSPRAWTTAASVGTIDEDSAAIAQFRNFTVTLQTAATGTAHVRYNIIPTDGISSFCPATQSQLRVRFRNGDDSGVSAKVAFEIHATNITSGGNAIIYSFDSNAKGAGASFTSFTDNPAIDFDFSTNVYWIEASIFRSSTSQVADLGSIQISETAGTPCP